MDFDKERIAARICDIVNSAEKHSTSTLEQITNIINQVFQQGREHEKICSQNTNFAVEIKEIGMTLAAKKLHRIAQGTSDITERDTNLFVRQAAEAILQLKNNTIV